MPSLSELMRRGWDDRVSLEYRYWMGDGVSSDQEMWASGSRDFAALFANLSPEQDPEKTSRQTALEFGCGVGRLLRQATNTFARVIGVDVSSAAISEAQRLLADKNNLTLIQSDGLSLSQIEEDSVDLVYSFAVLGHLPVDVLLGNISEFQRVLRRDGVALLQIYLGSEYLPPVEDSIEIRCYEKARFCALLEQMGFVITSLSELQMPFDATDSKRGIAPFVVVAKNVGNNQRTIAELKNTLIAGAEPVADPQWPGSRFEYLLAVTRVNQLVSDKQFEQAQRVLEFAIERYREAEPEALEVLAELKKGQS